MHPIISSQQSDLRGLGAGRRGASFFIASATPWQQKEEKWEGREDLTGLEKL